MARRTEVTRRNFLGGAAAGVAAGALGGPPLAAAQAPGVQELRTDVVVAGTGIAGMTAAVRAQKAGARVIVLEKTYEPGGTTGHTEGSVANNQFDRVRTNTPFGDPVVQRTVCDNVPRWYEWVDSLGGPISAPTGPAVSRRIPAVAWIHFMVRTLESGGGQLLVDTPMIRLLTNRQNEVIGVFAEGPKGPIRILAKAVVLATGGWPGNAQLVNEHITRHFACLHQRNASFGGRKPLLTGDGLLAALQIGAATSTGGFDGFYGHMMPARPTKQMVNPLTNYSSYHEPWCICVNLHGRRYADETQGKQAGQPRGAGEQLINQETARQPEAAACCIWDEPINRDQACANCGLGDLDKFPTYKDIGAPTAMANTLEDLVKQIEGWNRGIPAEVVLREITEYNEAARNGKAWALPVPKIIKQNAVPIVTPPFYAVLGQAGITATHGGLRVNAEGQVLSTGERPIAGLYAAGVDIGNFNNYVYQGNLCIGAGYGYVSGANAAKQPEPRGGWEIA